MKEPIKVLLLTDGLLTKKWVADIVEYIVASSDFEICGVVANKADKASKSSFFYRTLRFLDRKIFRAKSNPFQTVALSFKAELVHETLPTQKQFSDWLDDECLNFVKSKQPDLILRFGFRILRGSVLGIPKFGIWSLHHGDNKVNRGGPPGFWEVVQQDAVTGVTLQQITEDLDGGKVIGRAFTKTDLLSFHRNQVQVFETGIRLFQEKLSRLANGNLQTENTPFDFYSQRLFKDPGNKETFFITWNYIGRILRKSFFDFFYNQQWIILHSKNSNNEESFYRFQKLIPPKGTCWADPFPIYNEELYLFAEEKQGSKPGKIVCFKYLSDSGCFGVPQTVIEEKFHLSYPFVFKYDEQWYMIPESGESGETYIYKATDFPYSWEKEKTVFHEKPLFDTTPFEYEGNWYCFASERARTKTTPNDLLQLYVLEDDPLGKWEAHPASPIKIDVRGGRSAGRIIFKDGRLFRPAQLGAPKYGFGIQFYEIVKLDKMNFEERLVDQILPDWDKNNLATHTFNQEAGWQFMDCQRRVRKF